MNAERQNVMEESSVDSFNTDAICFVLGPAWRQIRLCFGLDIETEYIRMVMATSRAIEEKIK